MITTQGCASSSERADGLADVGASSTDDLSPETRSYEATLAAKLVVTLGERGLRVALAESCTGGAVAAAISAVPGASLVLWGGLVVYSDDAKVALADLDSGSVARHGPVSRATTLALAASVRRKSGADIGASVTGWAGPIGDLAPRASVPPLDLEPERARDPVGTVYLAVDAGNLDRNSETICVRRSFGGSREEVRRSAVLELMELITEQALRGSPQRQDQA